LQQWHN